MNTPPSPNASRRKWIRIALATLGLCVVLAIGAIAAMVVLFIKTRPPWINARAVETNTPSGPVLATFKGRKFQNGTIVRVNVWAGTVEPEDTGLDVSLNIDAGRVGSVVGVKRVMSEYNKKYGGGATEVIEVRWFKQRWSCFPKFWASREVEQFTSTIHPDYLETEN